MNNYEISYPKNKIDIVLFKYGFYLNVIFEYCKKEYLITRISSEINLNKNYKLLCYLQNKNSDLYLEVVKAINIFNETFNKYLVSNKISKKILGKAGIFINKRIRIELYQKGAIRYLNSKKELVPIIYLEFSKISD